MAGDGARDGPMPLLVVLLGGSFVLMILSGLFYMAGMPEDWARALFLATVIVWTVLGIAVVVEGQRATAAFARARPPPAPEHEAPPDNSGAEGKGPPAG